MGRKKYESAFIVRTPYHYINALEAVQRYGLDIKESALIVWTNHFSKKFDTLVDEEKWGIVKRVPVILRGSENSLISRSKEKAKDAGFLVKANVAAWQIGQVEMCFSVLPNHTHVQHIINKLGAKNIVILDEGVATFRFAKDFLKKKEKNLSSKLFWYDRRRNQDFEFFTSYPLERYVDGIEGNKIKRHSFEYAKSRFEEVNDRRKQGLILGTQRNDDINNIYDEFLSASVEFMNDVELVWYKPHRWESAREIKRVEKKYNINTMKNSSPIEIALVEKGIVPKKLSGFASTAIHSINKIFEGRVEKSVVFGLKSDKGAKTSYEYYESSFEDKVDIRYI